MFNIIEIICDGDVCNLDPTKEELNKSVLGM